MKNMSPAATAAKLVRIALRIDPFAPDADMAPMRLEARFAYDRHRRSERIQVDEQLVWLARSFAAHLPDDVRESVLRAAEVELS